MLMSQRLYTAFVANVLARMAILGLNRVELAERLGCTKAHVSAMLSGRRRPGLDSLESFAKVLEVDEPADLLRPPEKIRQPA
jgi:transcriptional regulator with XRE-family HTH domain